MMAPGFDVALHDALEQALKRAAAEAQCGI